MGKRDLKKSKNIFSWTENPKVMRMLTIIFILFCGVLFLADFLYERHPHFYIDRLFGFYGIYGFVMFTFIIFASKALRMLVMKKENFYGSKAVDCEEYPTKELGLEKKDVS